LDQTAAAVETSAAIAGVSLRASLEFLRAVPEAAEILPATELRSWGEMGRRIAMSDVEAANSFFIAGVKQFSQMPAASFQTMFQLCARQMTLSPSVATRSAQYA